MSHLHLLSKPSPKSKYQTINYNNVVVILVLDSKYLQFTFTLTSNGKRGTKERLRTQVMTILGDTLIHTNYQTHDKEIQCTLRY